MLALAVKSSLGQRREALLHMWWPVVETEVRRYASRGGEADELQGEGALALWEAIVQYDPLRHRTTLEQYIRNHVHRRVRRAYTSALGFERPKEVPLDATAPAAAPGDDFEQVQQRLDLNRGLQGLSPSDRLHLSRYLNLVLTDDAGPDEAARNLAAEDGVSFAAWKKRIERSRKRLQEKL